tara:strand:+ start:54 stop:578 length:525 start_codon:yes stop_codon:yes gene_type:complete
MGKTTFSGPVVSLGGFNPHGYNNSVNFDGTIASTALTVDSHGGRILTVNDADHTFTLPSIVATEPGDKTDPTQLANIGVTFRFFIETASTGVNINTDGTDKFLGTIGVVHHNAATNKWFHAVPGDSFDAIDLNGSTKGGIVGSYVEIQAVAAAKYRVFGAFLGSGTLVTPFATS